MRVLRSALMLLMLMLMLASVVLANELRLMTLTFRELIGTPKLLLMSLKDMLTLSMFLLRLTTVSVKLEKLEFKSLLTLVRVVLRLANELGRDKLKLLTAVLMFGSAP
jgi:hypothetical protein